MKVSHLERELRAWAAEGLVSEEQAAVIRARYVREAPAAARGRIVQALAVVGAVVAGLGVILFVAANWDGMARPLRVALLLAALLGAYGGGWILREQRATHPAVGEALLLLGGLVFAAAVFLVGQMYHVDTHWPLVFVVIALLTGATAATVRSEALATLSLLALGAWPLAELLDARTDGGAFVPVAATLFGVALYGLGTGDGGALRSVGFARPMRALGLPALLLGAFVFTFPALHSAFDDHPLRGAALAGVVALVVAAAAGVLALLRRSDRPTARWEAASLLTLTVLVPLAVAQPESPANADPLVLPLVFNLVVAALALGTVAVGYLNDEPPLVTVGIVLVGIDVLARYVDFFWDFLPRSVGFLLGGLLLLGLAWALERQRARLVARAG